jgi:hypothetical protein
MKTTTVIAAKQAILIFTLFLGFQIQNIMAKSPVNSDPAKSTMYPSTFVPVSTKASSSYNLLPENMLDMMALAPKTPKEATFDNDDNSTEISPELLKKFAPEPPAEAIINDSTLQGELNINSIKFLVPLEANINNF